MNIPKILKFATAGMACLGILLALYTVDISRVFMHLGHDPKACINCHIMNTAYATWQHSVHGHDTTCIDCHLPRNFVKKYIAKATDGLGHAINFTFNNYEDSMHISHTQQKIVNDNCIECHKSKTATIVASANLNQGGEDETDLCFRCHRDIVHGNVRSISATPGNLGVKELK